MKLRRVAIERMPGIDELEVAGFGDGITIVSGPNESGKSSLVRAMRALLWGREGVADRPYDVAASVELEQGTGDVVRDGGRTRWLRADGREFDAPPVPDLRYAECFTIELDQLVARGDHTTATIARQLRTELNGGVDVVAAREAAARRAPTGVSERQTLRAARAAYGEAQQRQRDLAAMDLRLTELERERDELAAAHTRHELLTHLLAARTAEQELATIDQELSELPTAALVVVHETDREQYQQLLDARDTCERAHTDCTRVLQGLTRAIADSKLAEPIAPERIDAISARIGQLEQSERELERLERARDVAHAAHITASRTLALDVADPAGMADQAVIPEADIALARRIASQHAELDAIEGALQRRHQPRAAAQQLSAARAAILATLLAGLLGATWLALTTAIAGWGLAVLVVACGVLALRAIREPDRHLAARIVEQRTAEERAEVEERRARLEASGDELAQRLGVRLEHEPGAFADWLHRIAQVRESALRSTEADAEFAHCQQHTTALAAQMADMLDLDDSGANDAIALRATCTALEQASRELRAAQDALPDAREAADTANEALRRAREHVANFRSARGVDSSIEDDAAVLTNLEALWQHRSAYSSLLERRAAAAAARDAACARIPDADQETYRDWDLARISAEHAQTEGARERHHALIAEVTSARDSVTRARDGYELTDALAARNEARDELHARRDEALRAQAAALLIEWSAESYGRDHAPPIVADANRILETATGGRYSLAIAGEDIAARDASRAHAPLRELAELSSGTRAQLLIATRVAFARSAERGERLPIFVDEALTTTDPERFDAIVESLADIAKLDERQVIYLTSNPGDGARIQAVLDERGHAPATLLRIGTVTSEAAAARVAQLTTTPRDRVPAPLPDETAAAWAARIGVPQLDPHLGADAAHVWHVHEPDLDLVYRLLDARLLTIGQARAMERSGLLEPQFTEAERSRLRADWMAWETFVAVWTPGRNRMMRRPDELRAVLEAARIDVATWHERIWPYVERAGGDPAAIDAMWELPAAERGFGRSSATIDKLRAQLEADGYLSVADAFDEATITARVRQAAGAGSVERVHSWLQRAAAQRGTTGE